MTPCRVDRRARLHLQYHFQYVVSCNKINGDVTGASAYILIRKSDRSAPIDHAHSITSDITVLSETEFTNAHYMLHSTVTCPPPRHWAFRMPPHGCPLLQPSSPPALAGSVGFHGRC